MVSAALNVRIFTKFNSKFEYISLHFKEKMNVQRLALIAICTAIVTVFVAIIPIPIPGTGGYTHPGSIAEVFVALAFGPLVGGIAAGLGAAIADIQIGYASFAPLTLVAHGLFGFLVGKIGWKKSTPQMIIAIIIGGAALIATYFIGQALFYGFGEAGPLVEAAFNLFQVSLGYLGLLLFKLVQSAFPQISQLGQKVEFSTRN